MKLGLFLLYYWIAYLIVTMIGIGHTIFNWKVLKIENKVEKVSGIYDIEAYAKTVPYHVLYNLIVWPIFSYLYLRQLNSVNIWQDALILGASWTIITIVFDLFGWVIIKHPWRMTLKEMYIDYQPWLTLIYLAIFISPFIAALII